MSKTKGGGSTRNGRDSNAQRLGVKVFDGTAISAGTTSFASVAPTFTRVTTSGAGKDDTLFATADGKVKFGSRHGRRLVDVLPLED